MTLFAERPRPLCIECGTKSAERRAKTTKLGFRTWRSKCCVCRRNKKQALHARLKSDVCSRCGFVPEHRCQLDLDHIDGNRNNYDANNLQTLCANCHRLKTIECKDWRMKAA